MKEFWKTGLALLVLVGLVAYIWKFEWGQEIPSDDEKETIFTVEEETVTAVTIDAADTESIRLVKGAEGWRLAAPLEVPADASEVDSILTRLGELEAEEVVVESTDDPAQYGFEAPSRTVTVRADGHEQPLVVQFGDTAPGGSALYARVPSEPRIYTVASFVVSSLDKEPFDLRDRDLLHAKRGDVRALEVEGPEGGYALARTDAGDWAFTEPLATQAGRWAVDGLLGTLENLEMESVAAEEAESLSPFGLDRPARRVRLVLADGSTRTLEIGSQAGDDDAGKYHAREASSALVAVVPGAIVTDLEKGMAELRAKKLLEVATYDTQGFDVVSQGETRTYEKGNEEDDDGLDQTRWNRTAPDEAELDTKTVEDTLFKIGGLEVEEFVDRPSDLGDYGLAAPSARVTVRAKGESWIEVGEKDGAYYGRRSGDDAVLKLETLKSVELLRALDDLAALSDDDDQGEADSED